MAGLRVAVSRFVLVSGLAACVTGAPKNRCDDNAVCTSHPDCPYEQPTGGAECKIPAGEECFFCSERFGRVDASRFKCALKDEGQASGTGGAGGTGGEEPARIWRRLGNLDCQ